jgi:hypothetical protein
MNATIRKGLIFVALGVVAVAGATVALASTTLSTPSLDGQYAKAHSDDSSFTTKDLICPSNYRVDTVAFRPTSWGIYGSVSRVEIECISPTGRSTSVKTAGFSSTTWDDSTPLGTRQGCNWDEKYMDGLKVVYDNYVKDAQLHCATTATATEDGEVLWPQEWAGWVLSESSYTDGNDDSEELRCNAGKVMTGLRLRYRSDADEIAVTRVQLYCSTISF